MADSGIDCLKIDFLKLSSLTSLARPAGIEPATLGLEEAGRQLRISSVHRYFNSFGKR